MRPKSASAILQFRRSFKMPYLPISAELENRTTTKHGVMVSPENAMLPTFLTDVGLANVAGRGNTRPPIADRGSARHSVAAAFHMACHPCRRYA